MVSLGQPLSAAENPLSWAEAFEGTPKAGFFLSPYHSLKLRALLALSHKKHPREARVLRPRLEKVLLSRPCLRGG